ncbi:MAG: hypothetical protein AABX51_01435 [Nanoarchaeota archaeon]
MKIFNQDLNTLERRLADYYSLPLDKRQFSGSYELSEENKERVIDDKNRIVIPAEIRKVVRNIQGDSRIIALTLSSYSGKPAIEFMPEIVYCERAYHVQETGDQQIQYFFGSKYLIREYDKSGRMVVPPQLRGQSQLVEGNLVNIFGNARSFLAYGTPVEHIEPEDFIKNAIDLR